MDKADILNALTEFAEQSPGMIPEDYDTQAQYDRDHRRWCDEPLEDFHKIREAVEGRDDIDGETIVEAIKWVRRIKIGPLDCIEYMPGQNGALEYRTAACNVLSQAMLDVWARDEGNSYPSQQAWQEFGGRIFERYFK